MTNKPLNPTEKVSPQHENTNIDQESTPLLSSPKGNGRLIAPSSLGNVPTRRRFSDHAQLRNAQHFASSLESPASLPEDTNKKQARTTKYFSVVGGKVRSFTNAVNSLLFPPSQARNNLGEPHIDRIVYDDEKSKKEFYNDNYNDLPWRCSFGTGEDDGVWLNRRDQPGFIMSITVWVLIAYSSLTVTLLAENNSLPSIIATTYCTVCALALASHAKTTFTDPGAVPQSAVPTEEDSYKTQHPMCSICQTFKPPNSHHCRICDRCICGMDHHCPWMNNCIGTANLKHFILFLIYVWIGSAFALIVFGFNYFMCSTEECIFPTVLVQLVRAMAFICVGSLLFTTSMIMNVTFGIMTGIGTIDRLKKKANNTLMYSDDEPLSLKDIFGVAPWYTWPFPVDPLFEDYDRVMGYSTTQRLLREKAFWGTESAIMSAGNQSFCQV